MAHTVQQSWSIPARCPNCNGQLAEAYKATTAENHRVAVDLRCPDCRHTWQMLRQEPMLRPVPDRRRD